MIDPISINQAAAAYANATRAVENTQTDTSANPVEDFGALVMNSLNGALGTIQKAENLSTAAALGNKSNLTDLVTAVSAADLALTTIVNIRDKAVNAYLEIIKMPI